MSRLIDAARLRKAIADFEASSGVRIDGWGMRNVGPAVSLLGRLIDGPAGNCPMRAIANLAKRLAEDADAAAKELAAVRGDAQEAA